MDRTRLDSSIAEMSVAETAYQTALRRVAEATRLVSSRPVDAAAAAQLRAANDLLTAARSRVETARHGLDFERATELATFDTADRLLGTIAGSQVLSLFPVSLEARLQPGRLRVRIWPDAVATSTHDPRLTEPELAAGKRYWRSEATVADQQASRAAWRTLCDQVGATRAAWTAHILTPANREALAPGVEPIFPIVAMQDEAAPLVPRAAVLPDRWLLIGIRDGARIIEHFGAPIPMDLAVGLDTTPAQTADLSNRDGEPLQLPPRMRWMTDFALGVQAGMAMDIPVAADLDRIDDLFVIGVRVTQTAAQNADTLTDLFTGHRYSRGFSFVPQNTPTNNSAAGGSGLPSRSERAEAAYDLERQPRAFAQDTASNGAAAARAFGIPVETFAAVRYSGAAAMSAEPDGCEPEAARSMQTVLWPVTLGAALEDFLLIPDGRADLLRDHFIEHVRAAGPVPALRIGRQPYGVLPATTLDGFSIGAGENIDSGLPLLLQAARTWYGMLRESAVFDGDTKAALRQLGRSTRLFAETTQQNPGFTGQNRWSTLAGALARATRQRIRDTWRTARVKATVDGSPVPVTRPLVDADTAAELAALATLTPPALTSRAVPTSVLARMVRQAVLLEWSRLARKVCEAAVDTPSRLDLASKATQNGSDIYIGVVLQALSPPGPSPGGPRDPVFDPDIVRPGALPLEPTRPVTPTPVTPTRPVTPVRPGTVIPAGPVRRARDERDPLDPRAPRDPRDPIDPVEPDPRDPRPPRGEPEVTAAERTRIIDLIGSLAAPKASAPGAARLAALRQALARLATLPSARLEFELLGVLDICNYRVDAWCTSLASRRLATVRSASPTGVVIGGWGYLQDVRRAGSDPAHRAEFIHAPSLDQAAAAAVLRSGARRAQGAGSAHADIDLSSKRVRLARWILEGVRNGRSLNELLGVRFERTVKGTTAESKLDELRSRFGRVGTIGVLDGLALHEAGLPASSDAAMVRGATAMSDALDAVADALTAEAVYQIVRGNPIGALTSVDTIAAGTAPPQLQVTETPPSGARLTHRVAIVMPAGATASGWPAGLTPRSLAEPVLDAWCGLMLGPADECVLTLEHGAQAVSLPLSSVGLSAIDVVLAGRAGGEELEARVAHAATLTGPPGARLQRNRVWSDLVGLCDALSRVLTRSEVLRADAFEPPSAMGTAAPEAVGDLPQRAESAVQALTTVGQGLLQPDAAAQAQGAVQAAAFGVRVPGLLPGSVPTAEELGALRASIDARLAAAEGASARERLRAIFGGELPGVVTFTPRDPATLTTATAGAATSLFGGDPLAPHAWLDAIGRTRPRTTGLSEALQRREIAGKTGPAPLLVAQAPWTDGDRWIATAFRSATERPPTGRLSILLHAPAGFVPAAAVGGLLIDAWTETVPAATRDTAMALRFNNASTRAPQVILLAVHPNPVQAWTTEILVNVLHETITLTRMRMQPASSFSRGGVMPFAFLGQRPGGAGISFVP